MRSVARLYIRGELGSRVAARRGRDLLCGRSQTAATAPSAPRFEPLRDSWRQITRRPQLLAFDRRPRNDSSASRAHGGSAMLPGLCRRASRENAHRAHGGSAVLPGLCRRASRENAHPVTTPARSGAQGGCRRRLNTGPPAPVQKWSTAAWGWWCPAGPLFWLDLMIETGARFCLTWSGGRRSSG